MPVAREQNIAFLNEQARKKQIIDTCTKAIVDAQNSSEMVSALITAAEVVPIWIIEALEKRS